MMRSISFVDRLELEFSGNHFSHAIAVGDVDTDGLNELVIGNVDGVLAIFKGRASKPLKKCSGLGTITCIGIGDLFNTGKNALVSINTEGICHLFDISTASTPVFSRPSSSSPEHPKSRSNIKSMKPVHTQTLPTTNIKTMCIAAISPQGTCDLVVGHTDRCLAVYHWIEDARALQLVKKFTLSGQIGSVSVSVNREGTPQLLISQPGGTYVPLRYKNELEVASSDSPHPKAKNRDKQMLMQCNVVGQPQRRNPTSSTEVIGHIIDKSQPSTDVETTTQHSDIVALCTLDGTIRMLKNEVKQWELQVDHSLFAIEKLDVTGSGSDDIVACAWDGMTYIVDQKRNIVRYKFEQNVSAFTAGYYGLSNHGKHNEPCLIYTTFSNHIFIYYNITLPAVPSSNLFHTILQQTDTTAGLRMKLENLDDGKKRELFQECLYTCSQYRTRSKTTDP